MTAAPPTASPPATTVPATIGGHAVDRLLGEGGMGVVYLCRDEQLARPVAIKVLRPELLEQADMRERFLREARALARVSSPFVVSVHAVGEDPVVGPFVVMELLDGEDLLVRLRRETQLPWRDAVGLARDACAGLAAAHDAGLVHRDVKPANVFIVAGRARLTDFGLAREVRAGAGVTQAGMVVGTPAYLAPEVARGGQASVSSDLYALGATLFHAIAGTPPFPGDAPLEVLTDALTKPAPRLDAVVPGVPLAVVDLVDALLAKDPRGRPATIAEVDARLAELLIAAPAAASTADGASGRTTAWLTQTAAAPTAPETELGPVAPVIAPPSPPSSAPSSATVAVPVTTSGVSPALTSGDFAIGAPRIKSTSLTVMMTDIAGFTERTGRQSRDESARWLALHDALLQPVFRAFGGKVVKTLGDAFLVTFSSPTDAVLCGCAVQDRLFLHNNGARAEDRISVRVALSAGEVRLHKGDVFGEPVNLAARLEALAAPGEVLLSDAVFATMNAAEVRLEKRGEETLKGIARAVTVYRAVPDYLDGHSPPGPPFGGRALSRVKESAAAALLAQAPQALGRTREWFAPYLAQAKAAPRKQLAAACGALALALLFLAWAASDSRRDRIQAGKAREVIDEIDKIPAPKRDADDLTDLGFAQLSVGSRERAFASFQAALKKGADDGEILEVAISALSEKDDDGAEDVIAAWQGSSVDRKLAGLLDEPYLVRHHALDVLDKRKTLTDAHRVKVAMEDVEEDDCGRRRSGMLLLKRAGKGSEALSTVRALKNDMPRNLCMALEVGGAEDAIRKRTEEK